MDVEKPLRTPDHFNENASGAVLSECGKYRYLLWRLVPHSAGATYLGHRVLWIMLNPSTADASVNDATVRRCIGFAQSWGYSGIEIVNLYAWRATDPAQLRSAADPIGPENDKYLEEAMARADLVVCAWGNNVVDKKRVDHVVDLAKRLGKTLHHLGLTGAGQPKHPVRLHSSLTARVWQGKTPEPVLHCAMCGLVQNQSPSGWVCENGHGGVPGLTLEELGFAAPDPPPAFGTSEYALRHGIKHDGGWHVKHSEPFLPVDTAKEPEPEPTGPVIHAELAETPPEWNPSPDQEKAIAGIREWWDKRPVGETTTLGGFAGTGKTTLVGKLAYDLLSAGGRVCFATPTGKAAQVLRKSLTRSGVLSAPVSTVHGLIYIPDADPMTGRVRGWKRRPHLDADLLVLDEASMVTRKMYYDLESFGVPILAVGDHGQLPPVGEEAFLMANPEYRLEKIHRQARGNPIIRLANMLRNGAPDSVVREFIEDMNDERVQEAVSAMEARHFAAPPGMVLCYTNRARCDINNDLRHELFCYSDEDDPQVEEVVICLKNHKLDEGVNMIANGMRGVVKACRNDENNQHTFRMDIEFDEPLGLVADLAVSKHQFLRDKTFKGFDEVPGDHRSWWSVGALFDYGYALTCHKAQGSQADNVSVFMEGYVLDRLSEDDRRRWKYTAATRAAEKLMLVF